jgi:hypothetical protein
LTSGNTHKELLELPLFRRSEEDQDFELLLDVVEPMLQFRIDENDGTSAHLGIVGADLHAGSASDDVVHLVFLVRLLGIGPAFWQNVDARAHGRDAEELKVQFVVFAPLAGEIVDVEVVRYKAPVFAKRRASTEI